jgi:hypothetical protein
MEELSIQQASVNWSTGLGFCFLRKCRPMGSSVLGCTWCTGVQGALCLHPGAQQKHIEKLCAWMGLFIAGYKGEIMEKLFIYNVYI